MINRGRAQRLLSRSRQILSKKRRLKNATPKSSASSAAQNATGVTDKTEDASSIDEGGKSCVKKTRRSSVWQIGDLPNPKQPFELEKTKFYEVYFGDSTKGQRGGTTRRRRYAENLDQLMYDGNTCPPLNTDEEDLHFANSFLNALKAYLPETNYWELINRLSSFQLLADEEIKKETGEEEVSAHDELAFNIYRSVAEMVEDPELLELLTGFLTEHQASVLRVHETWRDITDVRNFVEKVRTQIRPEVRKTFWRQCGKMAMSMTSLSATPQTSASPSTSTHTSSSSTSTSSSPIASRAFETFARALRHKPYLLTELLRLSPYHKPPRSLKVTAPDFEVIRLGEDPAADASNEDVFEEVTTFAHEDRANCPCPCHAGRTARTRHCADCGLRVLGGQLMWDNANVVVHFPPGSRPPEATVSLGESVGSTASSHSPRRKTASTGDLLSFVCTAVGRDRASLREMALRSWSEQCRQRRNSDPPPEPEMKPGEAVEDGQRGLKSQDQKKETAGAIPDVSAEAENQPTVSQEPGTSKNNTPKPTESEREETKAKSETSNSVLEGSSNQNSGEDRMPTKKTVEPESEKGAQQTDDSGEVVVVKVEPEETRGWCMEEDAELLTYLQTNGISDNAFQELMANSSRLAGRSVLEMRRRFDYLMTEYQRMHGNTDGEAPWNQWEDKILLEYCQANGFSSASFEAVSEQLNRQRTPANLKRRFKALMRLFLESNQMEYDSDAFESDIDK